MEGQREGRREGWVLLKGKLVRSKTLSKKNQNKHLSTPSDAMNHTIIVVVSPSVKHNFGTFPF